MIKRAALLIFGLALAVFAGVAVLPDLAIWNLPMDGPAIVGPALVMAQYTILPGRHSFADNPVPNHPILQPLAISYMNRDLIFRDVMPEVMVDYESYKYWVWTKEQGFTVPDTKIGRRSQANEIEFSGELVSGSTEDYGLKASVPRRDKKVGDSQATNIMPLQKATEGVMKLVELQREQQTAGLVFKAATYNASNKETLAGNSRWDTATGDPVAAIEDAKDKFLYDPNTLVIGQLAWRKLRRNPNVIKSITRMDGDKGIASRDEVRDIFEVENLLIGTARINASRPGQDAALDFGWGKHAALLYLDRTANPTRDAEAAPTFGFTAMWGDRIARSWMVDDMGLEGADCVLAGERRGLHIVDKDLGYFFETAVS